MTPKERAAMQQALEALLDAQDVALTDMCYHDEITALREALAERKVLTMTQEEIVDAIRSARIEQAEQRSDCERMEPVAEVVMRKQYVGFGRHEERKDVMFLGEVKAGDKLYTASVRTKDLTDEELWEAAKTAKSNDLTDAFRAVIAADREKNK